MAKFKLKKLAPGLLLAEGDCAVELLNRFGVMSQFDKRRTTTPVIVGKAVAGIERCFPPQMVEFVASAVTNAIGAIEYRLHIRLIAEYPVPLEAVLRAGAAAAGGGFRVQSITDEVKASAESYGDVNDAIAGHANVIEMLMHHGLLDDWRTYLERNNALNQPSVYIRDSMLDVRLAVFRVPPHPPNFPEETLLGFAFPRTMPWEEVHAWVCKRVNEIGGKEWLKPEEAERRVINEDTPIVRPTSN